MKKQQQTIKVNGKYTVSIVKYEELPFYEVAVLENGEITYSFRSDVERFESVSALEEGVQELISEITTHILSEEFEASAEDGDATTLVEGFTYNLWIYTCYDFSSNSLWWEACTLHQGRWYQSEDIEESEANRVTRKTFKGLHNFVSRYADK